MLNCHFRPELLLRTPLWSYAHYAPGKADGALEDPDFRLALFLASPAFYRLLETKGFHSGAFTEKEVLSLRKYYNRMCFRPTPFGLFSAITLTAWGEEGQLVLQDGGTAKIHVLPDQELAAITGKAMAADLFKGAYFLNPALYRLGREFRFIRSAQAEGSTRLSYSLESLEANALTGVLVDRLLGRSLTAEELVALVIRQTGCGREEASGYLAFLREAGVVFSSLDANITGTDYLQRWPDHLPGIRDASAHRLPELEKELCENLLKRGLARPGKYFYVNAEKKAVKGSVPLVYRERLAGALQALQKLSLPSAPALLSRFIKDFSDRFDQAKVPLLQALDPDAGVGYGDLAEQAGGSGLLKALHFPAAGGETAGQLTWSPGHRLLLEKWNQAGMAGVIRLEAADLEKLPVDGGVFPPGMAVMFRLTAAGLLVESAGGVTANGLIGRFTAVSDEVRRLGREIALEEQAANPEVIFAEIGALSDLYTDNVNRRQHLYDYELPVNAVSLLPPERQVMLRDLLVSVRDGEVIMESGRLQKRVVPRLSSAYNFHHNHLAVFRFLCDLQYQSLRANLSFDLAGFFPGMAHYPRVEYEGVILSPAKWLVGGGLAALPAAELRAKLRLPGWVALSRHDQQLVFNLDDAEQFRFFGSCLRGMTEYELREFLLPGKGGTAPVVDPGGQPLINQLIAFLVNSEPAYRGLPAGTLADSRVERDFVPGSGWLYLKIYCNPHTANELLVRRVLPVIRKVVRGKDESWFFIRYQDPGAHLRLRIRLPERRVGMVLGELKDRFAGLVSGQLVREYRAETYRRELERYGGDMIEWVEGFFRASSDLVVGFLRREQEKYAADQLAVSGFEVLLSLFIPDLPGQIAFLSAVTASFYTEFKGDKALRVELDQLYRGSGKEFAVWAGDRDLYRELRLQKVQRRFESAVKALLSGMNGFEEPRRHNLLADLIHMHLNRVYASRQRQQEFILYYCFHKYKQSRLAMQKRASLAAEFAP